MDPGTRSALPLYDQGQKRLSAAIVDSCEAGGGLSVRLERAIAAALSLLASDPDLAELLCERPERAGEAMWRRQVGWCAHYGTLLRGAAERDGAGLPPFFVEPMLIGGVVFLLSRHVRACGARHLEDLLPTIHWYLLSYYVSPAEAGGSAPGRPVDAWTATGGKPV
jgi:hypothetical protein